MIGIYTPYRRCETTASALRLADYAMACGLGVKLATGEMIRAGVHPRWDSRIRRGRDVDDLRDWARGCEQIVWFDPEVFAYTFLQQDSPRIEHHLVPSWHRLTTERLIEVTLYSKIVVPTSTAMNCWMKTLAPAVSHTRFRYCPWDGGIEPTTRSGFVAPGEVRLFVWLSSSALRDFGHGVVDVLGTILRDYPMLRVTVYRERSFSRSLYARFRRLGETYTERFLLADQLPPHAVSSMLRCHDWTWIPSTRADFGTDALIAKACGAPPITWAVPPFYTCTTHMFSGFHIPCDRSTNWFGSPVAVPSVSKALVALRRLLDTPSLLDTLRGTPEVVTQRAKTFEDFWARVWGVEIR